MDNLKLSISEAMSFKSVLVRSMASGYAKLYGSSFKVALDSVRANLASFGFGWYCFKNLMIGLANGPWKRIIVIATPMWTK
ncbi:hypothetical protein WICPIJ_007510 [Wickerhamomyces pijperi]|uniref:Uncharacterized protein n=1 Tax=Wickerhamomyces pijperi TaxID=599730 RepID=A0A9P8TJW5_WICPI|nr:hypothetical protein WICPIJ_007510 [Wickerhamomyces pijperi]